MLTNLCKVGGEDPVSLLYNGSYYFYLFHNTHSRQVYCVFMPMDS